MIYVMLNCNEIVLITCYFKRPVIKLVYIGVDLAQYFSYKRASLKEAVQIS